MCHLVSPKFETSENAIKLQKKAMKPKQKLQFYFMIEGNESRPWSILDPRKKLKNYGIT